MTEIQIVNGMMTPQQLASFLQVSTSTLKGWRISREGPRFARIGRSIRYNQAEVNVWVESVSRKERRSAS